MIEKSLVVNENHPEVLGVLMIYFTWSLSQNLSKAEKGSIHVSCTLSAQIVLFPPSVRRPVSMPFSQALTPSRLIFGEEAVGG